MQAVILVAGRGTRMEGLTDNVPKPMLRINNKPILEHKLSSLPKEIDEVILIVGYKKEIIQDYFGNEHNGLKIIYIEQTQLNGTAGAIKLAANYLKDKFLVLMGDDLYIKEDLEELIKYDFALLSYETEKAQRFGLIEIDNKGNLSDIIERPHDKEVGLINTGAYIISKPYFKQKMIKISDLEYGLPQTLVSMKNDYNIKILKTKKWQPVGSPLDLRKAEEVIKNF